MDENIMKCILDAAIHLNTGEIEDAKEYLRDAIELIDTRLFNIEEVCNDG